MIASASFTTAPNAQRKRKDWEKWGSLQDEKKPKISVITV